MSVTVLPDELAFGGARPLRGRLRLPGDKSISHRALLFAALATGRSTITQPRDRRRRRARPRAALDAARRRRSAPATSAVDRAAAAGIDALREPDDVLDCGNTGTTMRVLVGRARRPPVPLGAHRRRVAARSVRCAASSSRCARWARTIDGRADGDARAARDPRRRRSRGMRHELAGRERAGEVRAGARRPAGRRRRPRSCRPRRSRDHTERMLARARRAGRGRRADASASSAGAPEPFELEVPGDPSSAAFFVVAASITPGSELTLEDVALQPDPARFRRRAAAHGRRHRGRSRRGERCGEPVGDLRVRSARAHARRRSRATRSRTSRTRSPRSRSRPRSPTASPRSATRPSSRSRRATASARCTRSSTQLGLAVEPRADGLVDPRRRARGPRCSRATATTASRWRPRSRRTRSTARRTVRGWQAVGVVVSRVRRRPRRGVTGGRDERRADGARSSRSTGRRARASRRSRAAVARRARAAGARHRRDVPRGHARRARDAASRPTTTSRVPRRRARPSRSRSRTA